MRFVDVVVQPDGGWSSFGTAISGDPAVRREAIHQLTLMDDGSVVMLYELSGQDERIREALERHFKARAYQLSEMEGNGLVYAHHEPNPVVEGLVRIPQQYGIVIDTPMQFTRDGGLRLTLVGDEGDIRAVMGVIPEEVSHTVEKTGSYRPGTERLFAELTDRQQEILLMALEMGYYEQPRRATYEEIAAELDCTKTTVGEHIRKAEKKVLMGIAPSPA